MRAELCRRRLLVSTGTPFFDTTKMQTRRAARWLDELHGYRLKWNYKPGPQNVVADALSRHPVVAFTGVQYVGSLTSHAAAPLSWTLCLSSHPLSKLTRRTPTLLWTAIYGSSL